MARIKNTTIFTDDGHLAGIVFGNTFKRTFSDAHILRHPPALAIDDKILEQLQALGVTRLEFTRRTNRTKYAATLAHFLDKSFALDRGYGKQHALPLTGFSVQQPGDAYQLSFADGWR